MAKPGQGPSKRPLVWRLKRRGLELAPRVHRRLFRSVKLVGVTGSCGRSTSTNLIATVLATCGPVQDGTVQAVANTTGVVARTVLKTPLGNGVCVIELSGAGPETFLRHCGWLRPDIAVFTAIEPFLKVVRTADASRKVVVFGGISDHTQKSSQLCRKIARDALETADIVAFVGRWAKSVAKLRETMDAPDRLVTFERLEPLNACLREVLRPGALPALKGSARVDHLERLILDRTGTITCWRHGCRKLLRCQICPQVGETHPAFPESRI